MRLETWVDFWGLLHWLMEEGGPVRGLAFEEWKDNNIDLGSDCRDDQKWLFLDVLAIQVQIPVVY